jgi:hypothetical protein
LQRIFDYSPAAESTLVPRILISIHKTIDIQFPKAAAAPRQFTKTVFGEGGESTAVVMAPKDTSAAPEKSTPPPPPQKGSRKTETSSPSVFSRLDPIGSGVDQFSQKSMPPITQDYAPMPRGRKVRIIVLLLLLMSLVALYAYLNMQKQLGIDF